MLTENSQILDVGCGSGILAISALLMTPTAIGYAIDIDPEAVEVTSENAALNQVKDRLDISTKTLVQVPKKFALVLANLTTPTLVELAPQLANKVVDLLILSGILTTEGQKIIEHFTAQGLILAQQREEGDWCAYLFRRSSQ